MYGEYDLTSHVAKHLNGSKLYYGKWFLAVRLPNDATFGLGKVPAVFRANVVKSRPNYGV